jgi:Mg-chelatase subunit ChlD
VAYDIAEFVTEAIIVTGTSRFYLETNYGQPNPSPPPTWTRLGVPTGMWKIIYIPDPLGKDQVGAWFAANENPAYTGAINCLQRKLEVVRIRDVPEVLRLAGYEKFEVVELINRVVSAVQDVRALGNISLDPEDVREVIKFRYPSTCELGLPIFLPLETGENVVRTAVNLIKQEITGLKMDYELVFRLAILTDFGSWDDIYKGERLTGIFSISEDILAKTKDADQSILNQIQDKFEINWKEVNPEDMVIPMYGALAAFLHYDEESKKPNAIIPFTISASASLISLLFPSTPMHGSESVEEKIQDYYDDNPSRGVYDLIVVLDGSASIGESDFRIAKSAVANLLSSTKTEASKSRVGLILYSTISTTVINLANTLTPQELSFIINNMEYPNGDTLTHLGILDAISMFRNMGIPNRPMVSIVLTDGQSTNPSQTIQAAEASRNMGIITFAIGIGNSIVRSELRTIVGGNEGNIFEIGAYENLMELPFWLNVELDSIPLRPVQTEPFNSTVAAGDTLYCVLDLPPEGLTVEVVTSKGAVESYYSFSYRNPSEAYYDGKIGLGRHYLEKSMNEKHLGSVKDSIEVFVSIQGLEDGTDFSLIFLPGKVEGLFLV